MSSADVAPRQAATDSVAVLLVRAGTCRCALPLRHVVETMRPLPVEPVRGAPAFLRGVAVVRGAPTPVVDLAAIVGRSAEVGRFVTISTGGARVALAVEEVLGLAAWTRAEHAAAPPLLRDAVDHVLEAMTALDEQLVFVLSACAIAERAAELVASARTP